LHRGVRRSALINAWLFAGSWPTQAHRMARTELILPFADQLAETCSEIQPLK